MAEMRRNFEGYNLTLNEVLIGTPRAKQGDTQIETILRQLRERQVSREQLETYRTKEVLFDTLAEVPYNKPKMEILQRRLEKLNERKMSAMFMALKKTEKVLGYLPPEQRSRFYRQWLLEQVPR